MRIVYLALAWVLGLIIGFSLKVNSPPILWIILLGFASGVLYYLWPLSTKRILCLLVIAFLLGLLRTYLVPIQGAIAQYNNAGLVLVEGIVVEVPETTDTQTRFIMEAEQVQSSAVWSPTNGKILVVSIPKPELRYGDRVRIGGILLNPGRYDTFSYADYLARNGVFSLINRTNVEIISSGHGNPFLAFLIDLNHQASEQIRLMLPEPAASLLVGILLGDESGIDDQLEDDFSRVGASHIIAISGFNMVVVSALITRLLQLVTDRKVIIAVISITALGLYSLFVGLNAAVLRAALMSIMMILAMLMDRRTYLPASLAFTVLLLSFIQPFILWDISFQLSFFAVLGITLFAEPLSNQFRAWTSPLLASRQGSQIQSYLNEALMLTLAVQITTLPLMVVYFHSISLVSPLVNLLILPFQSLIFILGALALGLSFIIPVLGQLLFWLVWLVLIWTISIVRLFADLSFASLSISIDERLVVVFFVVLIGGAMVQVTKPHWALRLLNWIQQKPIKTTIMVLALLLFGLLSSIILSRPDQALHVWFLDLGHQNAVFIQSPNGAQILIDGGSYPTRLLTAIGDRMPFYDRELEMLIITQQDPTNLAGFSALTQRYEVGALLNNRHNSFSGEWGELIDNLRNAQQVDLWAGYDINLDDGLRIEVLNPSEEAASGDHLTDDALLLRLSYGEVSFLLTANLSEATQSQLASQLLPVTVLQIPHHASADSLDQAFFDALQPQVAIVQTDSGNRLGDPDPNTLEQIGDNTPIYRTDERGHIHLWTDGVSLWVQTDK